KLDGVVQIAVKPEINLTFATGLRSILRGDPNVIMVGEMRDFETAEIAIRAALTGHLVFSTLHTNDSVGGITRLIDMGVEPFLVGSSVRAFIAQRLVRRLCPLCKIPESIPSDRLEELGFSGGTSLFKAHGCEACRNSGYQGRIAIYEICQVTPALQDMIQRKVPGGELKKLAAAEGMHSLRENGWERVKEGITSIGEVMRVTAAEARN
ncbi:MAG TPA: ATPase, T2SS/T4P/T4SS family, partial [Chthoniobacterales bacterium]